jgi:lysophospholipase L1-like esterase
LDFYDNAGQQGRALMLQDFAAAHNVKMVVVAIGGNDFDFASIEQSCVGDFLTSPTWWKNYCNDDSSVTADFTAANVAAVRARIATAYQNIGQAMRSAGYDDNA